MSHYAEALWLRPGFVNAHINAGIVLKKTGELSAAAEHFSEVLRLEPGTQRQKFSLERPSLYCEVV